MIAYKSKLQPVVATSSTEAKFYATVIAGKLAKTFTQFFMICNFLLPSLVHFSMKTIKLRLLWSTINDQLHEINTLRHDILLMA
jgi:hypothetical protein